MKFLLLALLSVSSLPVFGRTIEVFSMNLHCALGDWRARLDIVVEEIVRRNPHVIGLQEVCKNSEVNMTSYILGELQKNSYVIRSWASTETHRSFISYQEELLIISRLPSTQKLEGALPSLKFFENRFVGLEIEGTWFVTTHLHFALPSIRKDQYEVLNQEFGAKNSLVFGDMNSHPGNGEFRIFHASGWKAYFNGPTYPSRNPTRIFDGFWFSRNENDLVRSAEVEILFKDHPGQPSDHLGIYLTADYL